MIRRFLLTFSTVFALALGACGGQSLSPGGGDAGSGLSAGSSSQAGSSNGGSGNTAGSSSTAGKASGGQSSGGSGAGGSSAGGASGGGWGEACRGPATMGAASCTAAFMYYTHDADRGLCRPILYGGCGGTKNLYPTLEECQAACSGGWPSSDVCEMPTDCELGSAGCCGACDTPDITTRDYIAYNRKFAGQVAICGDVACGACPEPEGESTYKYLIPACVKNRCVVRDLRQDTVTSCTQDSECKLRHGSGCCESCGTGTEDALAVRADGSFEELVCGASPPACPPCVPVPFEERAVCVEGRCAVASP